MSKVIRGLKDLKFRESDEQYYYFEAWVKKTGCTYGWFQYREQMYQVSYACTMENDNGLIKTGGLYLMHIQARQLYPLSPPNIKKVKEFITVNKEQGR